jgi:hypothetical protein
MFRVILAPKGTAAGKAKAEALRPAGATTRRLWLATSVEVS